MSSIADRGLLLPFRLDTANKWQVENDSRRLDYPSDYRLDAPVLDPVAHFARSHPGRRPDPAPGHGGIAGGCRAGRILQSRPVDRRRLVRGGCGTGRYRSGACLGPAPAGPSPLRLDGSNSSHVAGNGNERVFEQHPGGGHVGAGGAGLVPSSASVRFQADDTPELRRHFRRHLHADRHQYQSGDQRFGADADGSRRNRFFRIGQGGHPLGSVRLGLYTPGQPTAAAGTQAALGRTRKQPGILDRNGGAARQPHSGKDHRRCGTAPSARRFRGRD